MIMMYFGRGWNLGWGIGVESVTELEVEIQALRGFEVDSNNSYYI